MTHKLLNVSLIGLAVALAGCGTNQAEDQNLESSPGLENVELENSDGMNPQINEERLRPDGQVLRDGNEKEPGVVYSISQVAQHASADDCWIVIEGQVFDVTKLIESGEHPGGAAILQGCGIDATEMFNNRPNGSGPHSPAARDLMPDYLIGDLAQE